MCAASRSSDCNSSVSAVLQCLLPKNFVLRWSEGASLASWP